MYDLEVSISCFSYGCWIYQYHLLKGHLSPLFYSVVVLNLVTVYIWVCFYNIFCSVGLFYIYTHTYICILEKAMALHSSPLAWKIPWTEEPGRLQSMGLLGVRHDWATSLSLFTFMHWRRKCQPTPVFLPGESQGRGSLVGCHLWGHTELDTTEAT